MIGVYSECFQKGSELLQELYRVILKQLRMNLYFAMLSGLSATVLYRVFSYVSAGLFKIDFVIILN